MSVPDCRQLLAQELEERSHDVDGNPITFAAVTRSARRIQRRRRMAGGLAAVAALTVAVPAGVAITNDIDRINRLEYPPAPVVPSPDHATPRPDGSYSLSMSGLPQGPKPALVYLWGRTLNLPDGSVIELQATYSQVVGYGAGWLVHGAGTRSAFLDTSGRVLQTGRMENGFAVSADHSHVGAVRVGPSGADTLTSMPVMSGGLVDAWSSGLGARVQAVGYLAPDQLVWQSGGVRPRVGIASPHGATYLSGLVSARGTSESAGLVSGTIPRHGSRCSGVVQPSTGTGALWTTCGYRLGKFSPDGQYVFGTDTFGQRQGSRSLAVLDAHTGELVVDYAQDHDSHVSLVEVGWEGDDHLLAVANDGSTWRIIRLDLHGNLQQATDPAIAGPSSPVPFHLTTQP